MTTRQLHVAENRGAPAATDHTRELTRVRDIRKLTGDEASRHYRARIEGVVTYFDPAWAMLFVQDDTAGIYVDVHGQDPQVRTGDSQKGLALDWQVASEVPAALSGDPMRVRQVLLNLLSNALKFTDNGKISVCMTIDPAFPSGAEEPVIVRIAVSDTGIGIAMDKHQSIFENFTQADGSTTRKYGGTGLGLAISARLVDMMGGRISVDSAAGHGSTFHFTARFMPAAVVPRPAPAARPSRAVSPLSVLLAEDNAVNQLLARRLLEQAGHRVTPVGNGREALDALERSTFDVILMDIQMPELDGLAATAAIRAAERGSGRRQPIIAMTAHALKGDRERCIEAGMDGYIAKPITPAQLHAAISDIVGLRHSQPGHALAAAAANF